MQVSEHEVDHAPKQTQEEANEGGKIAEQLPRLIPSTPRRLIQVSLGYHGCRIASGCHMYEPTIAGIRRSPWVSDVKIIPGIVPRACFCSPKIGSVRTMLVMLGSFIRPRCISIRSTQELGFAFRGTEVVSLSAIFRPCCRLLFFNLHSANRVFCHGQASLENLSAFEIP